MWQDFLNWCSAGGLYILAGILFLAGYVGAVLPYPGCFVTLLGCGCLVAAGDSEATAELGWGFWLVQILLATFGTFVDNITTALGAKALGGSRAAFWCSMLGLFIGAFFFPFGLIICPYLAAFLAELIFARKNVKDAAKCGLGATLGVLSGAVCKIIVSTIMMIHCIIALCM